MYQAKMASEYTLHFQVKDEKLNSEPNRSYGYAFDVSLTGVHPDTLRDIIEGLDAHGQLVPSLAGTDARYFRVEVGDNGEACVRDINNTLHLLCNLPPAYCKAPEEEEVEAVEDEGEPPVKLREEKVFDTPEAVNVPAELDGIWVMFMDGKTVLLQSKEQPRIAALKEVVNDYMSKV